MRRLRACGFESHLPYYHMLRPLCADNLIYPLLGWLGPLTELRWLCYWWDGRRCAHLVGSSWIVRCREYVHSLHLQQNDRLYHRAGAVLLVVHRGLSPPNYRLCWAYFLIPLRGKKQGADATHLLLRSTAPTENTSSKEKGHAHHTTENRSCRNGSLDCCSCGPRRAQSQDRRPTTRRATPAGG